MYSLLHEELAEHETPAVIRLFDSIVAAERDSLTAEQVANPREYLLDVWHKAAEAVMRPIHTRLQLEEELRRLRDEAGKTDDPF